MFDWAKAGWSKTSCRRYRARLGDDVPGADCSAASQAKVDPEFDAHLRACERCRQSREDALLARELLRQTAQPVRERSDRLVARVMSSIQEELSRRASETIWKPLELLASKFALVAAMILLLLGAYLAKSTPRLVVPSSSSGTAVGALIPESPQPPSSPDEIVMSLAGAEGQ